jgi:hypothetical protein
MYLWDDRMRLVKKAMKKMSDAVELLYQPHQVLNNLATKT